MPSPILPPIGPDLRQWGRSLSNYLQRNLSKLGFKTADDNPSEDGVILWDREREAVVVSSENQFRSLGYGGDYAEIYCSTEQLQSATFTPTYIEWDTTGNITNNVALDDTDAEKIVFENSGVFQVTFHGTHEYGYLFVWYELNGSTVTGSGSKFYHHSGGNTVGTTMLIEVAASDYLQVQFAGSSASYGLVADATTYSASIPTPLAAKISITQVG